MQAPDLKGGLVYLPPSLVVASSGAITNPLAQPSLNSAGEIMPSPSP
jgi:hypothetical protein